MKAVLKFKLSILILIEGFVPALNTALAKETDIITDSVFSQVLNDE